MLRMKGFRAFLLGTSLLLHSFLDIDGFSVNRIQERKEDVWLPIGNKESNENRRTTTKPLFAARISEITETNEEYKDLIKHLEYHEDDTSSSNTILTSSAFPSREIINIFPKIIEVDNKDPDKHVFSGIETFITNALSPLIKLVSNLFSRLSLDSTVAQRQTNRQVLR